MDADGNVFVDGHPHIVIAPQGGNTGIGGEATDAALSVEGDARFDGGVRLGTSSLDCTPAREGMMRKYATGDAIEFCDSDVSAAHPPIPWGPSCLADMTGAMDTELAKARGVVAAIGALVDRRVARPAG